MLGKVFLKLIDAVITAATAMVIILAAVIAVPPLIGYNPYYVQSGSMEPTIHVGALEFVDTHQQDLKVGDIGTFRLMDEAGFGGELVTHRVTKINDDGTYTLKGDANELEDFVTYEKNQVVGRHLFSVPLLGYLFAAATGKVKIVVIVLVLGFNAINLMLQGAFLEEERND